MWKKQGVGGSDGGGFVVPLLVTVAVAIIAVIAVEVTVSSTIRNGRDKRKAGEEKKDKKAAITAKRGNGTTTPLLPTRPTGDGAGALSNPMFVASADRIKNLSNKDAALDDRDKLQLYSLYKQATVGNAPKWFTPTSLDLLTEQAKHHAWSQLRGMPWQEATQAYIQVAQALLLQVHGNNRRQDDDDESIDHDALSDDEVDYTQPKTNGNATPSPRGNTVTSSSTEPAPASPPGGFGVGVSRPMVQEEEEEEDDLAEKTTKKPPHVALLQAAAKNDVQTIQRLINEQHKQGDNDNNQEAVNRLVNYCDEVGQTALHLAADQGFNDVVICLLNAGARVDAADQDGISVLQAAVIAGQTETCRILWQKGKANPDQADHDGDTPRLCAQDDGSREMKLLFGLYKVEEDGDAATSSNNEEEDADEEDNFTQDTEANTTTISEDGNLTPESLQRKETSQEMDETIITQEEVPTTLSEEHSIEV